jgi:hypothetical protein
MSPIADVVVTPCAGPGLRLVTGVGLAAASRLACAAVSPAAWTASPEPRVLDTARTSCAAAEVPVGPAAVVTRTCLASTMTRARRPERSPSRAGARPGSATKRTVVPVPVPAAAMAARSGADSEPTTPACWTRALSRVSTGITMAAATAARSSTVPARNSLPRTRSRTSRAATRPVSPNRGAALRAAVPSPRARRSPSHAAAAPSPPRPVRRRIRIAAAIARPASTNGSICVKVMPVPP